MSPYKFERVDDVRGQRRYLVTRRDDGPIVGAVHRIHADMWDAIGMDGVEPPRDGCGHSHHSRDCAARALDRISAPV
jgi:hypothetical protein